MGTDEMREIGAIVAAVLRATRAGVTASGQRSLVGCELDERARAAAEARARDLLGRSPLYPGVEL
jgi:hypothetical protein